MGETPSERLRDRVTAFYGELPDDEKVLLLAVLARADGGELIGVEQDDAEVAGFGFDTTTVANLSGLSLVGTIKSQLDKKADQMGSDGSILQFQLQTSTSDFGRNIRFRFP